MGLRSLPLPETPDDPEAFTILPDIIVHRRKKDHNLLVIEVKKNTNRDYELDFEEHRGLTGDGHYRCVLGLHLVLTVEASASLIQQSFSRVSQMLA